MTVMLMTAAGSRLLQLEQKEIPAIIKTYRVSHTDDLVSIQERSLSKRSYDYYKDIQT